MLHSMPPHHNANFQPDPKVVIKMRIDCTLDIYNPSRHRIGQVCVYIANSPSPVWTVQKEPVIIEVGG